MSFIDIENQQIRRDLLSLLNTDGDFAMNEMSLLAGMKSLGNPIARDTLTTQLHWLQEQALIALKDIGNTGITIAKLTQRGADVAQGLATVPNIARMPLD